MTTKIEKAVTDIKNSWKDLTIDSIEDIQMTVAALSGDQEIQNYLQEVTRDLPKGAELHRDQKEGFILLAYPELKSTYRAPHNHGNAWVIYSVISGEMEMGSYINSPHVDGSDRLIRKSRETLKAGDTRIYFPGEIHDTLCKSENAVVLRLTSADLREEENAGRMKRFQPLEA
jgi:hypothetical protein